MHKSDNHGGEKQGGNRTRIKRLSAFFSLDLSQFATPGTARALQVAGVNNGSHDRSWSCSRVWKTTKALTHKGPKIGWATGTPRLSGVCVVDKGGKRRLLLLVGSLWCFSLSQHVRVSILAKHPKYEEKREKPDQYRGQEIVRRVIYIKGKRLTMSICTSQGHTSSLI